MKYQISINLHSWLINYIFSAVNEKPITPLFLYFSQLRNRVAILHVGVRFHGWTKP